MTLTLSYKYTISGFLNFISNNKISAYSGLFFLLLGYGIKLFGTAFSIDTEAIISITSTQYEAWHSLGRTGLVLFKYLIGTEWYNNQLSSFLMVSSLYISYLLIIYLLNNSEEKNNSLLFFCIPFLSSPILAEMLGFLLTGMEIAIAISLIIISLMLLNNYFVNGEKKFILFAIFFTFVSFSIYLAMTTILVTSVAFLFLLRVEQEKVINRKHWRFLIYHIFLFVASYAFYVVFNKLSQFILNTSTHTYISEQFRWGKDNIDVILYNIWNHAIEMYSGHGIFYTYILSGILSYFILFNLFRLLKNKISIYTFGVAFFLGLSPLMMSFILGNKTTERTEMTYPLVFGFLMWYLYKAHCHIHWFKKILSILIIIIGFSQGYIVNRIFYTEAITYQQDVELVYNVKHRVDELGYGEKPNYPVAFIGSHATQCNNSCFSNTQLALTGRSLFEITFGNEHGTFVKNHFFSAQGVNYILPSNEQIQLATKLAETMPKWPSKGSVDLIEGIIIVNF